MTDLFRRPGEAPPEMRPVPCSHCPRSLVGGLCSGCHQKPEVCLCGKLRPEEHARPAGPVPESVAPFWGPEETKRAKSSEEVFGAAVAAMLGDLLDTDGLDEIPELRPLVDGVLYLDTLAQMYGPPGSLKSFAALDLAAHVGAGRPWNGRTTRKGAVVYLYAEGAGGLKWRVRAWERHQERRMDGVRFLPRPVQIASPEWGVLTEVCRRLGAVLIIVDTQSRSMVGIDENSNTDVGRIIDRLERLRLETGACVQLIHHSGYSGEHGRGASALPGALTTELRVKRDGKGINSLVTIECTKQKDGDDDLKITLAPHLVDTGMADKTGKKITSLVLLGLEPTEPQQSKAERIAAQLDSFGVPKGYGRDKARDALAEHGVRVGNDDLTAAIKIRKERCGDQ